MNNVDKNLIVVMCCNVLIIAAWLAACTLFYFNHPCAGAFCIAGPLFTCFRYNGRHS